MTKWKSFSVETRREAIDALTRFLVDCGSIGTAHDEQILSPEGDPADPIPPPPEIAKLTAYFPADTDLHALKAELLAFIPVLEESFGKDVARFGGATEITDTGWAEKWKEHFKPVSVSRRLVIRPSWEAYEAASGETILIIDPGQAFGTGTHETTQMCLQIIDDLYSGEVRPRRVLDVGTGTGILGIATAKLGATEVLGLDNDPLAVEVCVENATVNGVQDVFRAAATPVQEAEGTFDLVIANIIAEILIDMKQALLARLAPGGRVLLSGILDEKSGMVREEFEAEGAKLVEERRSGQWAALLLSR
ncbi:MAG TPA: 50S ribosomal protein L11 methyltransferase [Candidatus Deferrimicrobiaceae bacterium]|jgi:ribosomal protein L11 methyltransferase